MIPRHRPPFGLNDVVRMLFVPSGTVSVVQAEDLCASTCGIPHAVLLPSARAGICWALRAAVARDTPVIGPAYTCQAVHEAMARSGGRLSLVDADPNTFLMDLVTVAARQSGTHAILLSEIYGYSYGDRRSDGGAPLIRIFDTAMTVPNPAIFERLQGNDVAVTSFGPGKCVYAGWGGMALTRDRSLAAEIRTQRDAHMRQHHSLMAVRQGAEIFFRTLAHTRVLYGLLQGFRTPPDYLATMPGTWSADMSLTKEWDTPSTNLNRRLICRNVEHAAELGQQRRVLAARYRENLSGLRNMAVPPISSFAMSHYTIRVPSEHRDAVQASLRRSGIDTGRLFKFPGYLSKTDFPNAAAIASEVLNLPLDACLTGEDVEYISECVMTSVSRICSDSASCRPILDSPN